MSTNLTEETNQKIIRIPYKTPYRYDDLLDFFRMRALQEVELVDETSYSRTVRIPVSNSEDVLGWIRVENDPETNCLVVSISHNLIPHEEYVIDRVKYMFDVDRDPQAIAEKLAVITDVVPEAIVDGVLLPGCFEPFELACRSVIGQQVTVNAANKIAARIANAIGTEVDTGIDGLSRTWPTEEEILALESIENTLGELGVIKTRSRTINAIAQAVVDGDIVLSNDEDAEKQMAKLLALKGIGPWTANYIAMRILGHQDAFLESDAGVAHALPEIATPKERLAVAEAWHPMRSYAVITLWNYLSAKAKREADA